MIEPSLHELERDVEATRARLTRNLRTLRSSTARDELADALKHEALTMTNDMVDRTRSEAQSRVDYWVDDIKARAAENPLAVLAIAAGISWRLLRDPPIATALVGVGLFSLWRGGSPTRSGLSDRDYVDRAVDNLKQTSRAMAADMADRAGVAAETAGEALREWRDEAVSAARQTGAKAVDSAVAGAAAASTSLDESWQATQEAAAEAVDRVGQAAAGMQRAVKDQTGRWVDDAGDSAARLGRMASERRAHGVEAVRNGAAHAVDSVNALRSDTVNQLLLGAAGAAIAAAIGVAWQRRVSELETSD